jgi:hypothetical protein
MFDIFSSRYSVLYYLSCSSSEKKHSYQNMRELKEYSDHSRKKNYRNLKMYTIQYHCGVHVKHEFLVCGLDHTYIHTYTKQKPS